MGKPVKIWDFAENMIKLSGVQDIDIVEVGVRDIIGTTKEKSQFSAAFAM